MKPVPIVERGKPQDGIVSRYINRPLSRTVTRLLLKLPITPTAWTLMILIFPLTGAIVLTRGDYLGFVVGTILYQIHSILDGCDGEIARVKHLESERGRQIDNWCDHAGNILMVICLGLGLSRNPSIIEPWPSIYLSEGIGAAILLAVNEGLLLAANSEANAKMGPLDHTLYPRHREMMRRSGILFLGEKLSWWLVQMTKRDVALFVFVILAVISQAQWILHLLSAFALISLVLAAKAFLSVRSERNAVTSPRTR